MRTRNYQALTNYEIEKYLDRNDVIFIPLGNAETHDPFPVDCEYVAAEAWARLFAERFDGLFLPNLVYLPAGGTCGVRGTIQVSEFDAQHYMYAISRSLLAQGFRRQVYIPSHRQSSLFMHPVIHQIMDDVKVPLLFLEPHYLFSQKGLLKGGKFSEDRRWHYKGNSDEAGLSTHAQMLGAYQICGRLDDVPSRDELDIPDDCLFQEGWELNHFFPKHDIINECSNLHCPAPFIYGKSNDHASFPMYKTRAEMKREADIAEAHMRKLVDQVDFNVHLDVLKELDDYTQNVVVAHNKEHLPTDRWSY